MFCRVDMFCRDAVLAFSLALGLSACSTASTAPDTAASSSAEPTPVRTTTSAAPSTQTAGLALAGPGAVTKVLVFVEENHSLSQMKADMPYAFGLARQFGYATSYTATRHPSLPNYIAIVGGQTYGITNDAQPSANPVGGPSVFGQAVAAGKTAAVYADGMPENCAAGNGGSDYAVKHNPWAYFTKERDTCLKFDVPADRLDAAITNGTLPNVAMVVPNLCNDAHDCSLGTADTWFKAG